MGCRGLFVDLLCYDGRSSVAVFSCVTVPPMCFADPSLLCLGSRRCLCPHPLLIPCARSRWWNPAVEAQAVGRCHRIGQTKAVFVYRLYIAASVETKILEIQDKKQEMADGALGVEGVQTLGRQRLTLEDVLALFGRFSGEDAAAETPAQRAANHARILAANRARPAGAAAAAAAAAARLPLPPGLVPPPIAPAPRRRRRSGVPDDMVVALQRAHDARSAQRVRESAAQARRVQQQQQAQQLQQLQALQQQQQQALQQQQQAHQQDASQRRQQLAQLQFEQQQQRQFAQLHHQQQQQLAQMQAALNAGVGLAPQPPLGSAAGDPAGGGGIGGAAADAARPYTYHPPPPAAAPAPPPPAPPPPPPPLPVANLNALEAPPSLSAASSLQALQRMLRQTPDRGGGGGGADPL